MSFKFLPLLVRSLLTQKSFPYMNEGNLVPKNFSSSPGSFSFALKNLSSSNLKPTTSNSLSRGFHTTPPNNAVPPILLLLRPLAKGLAFLVGRNLRKSWQTLSTEQKRQYIRRLFRHRNKFAGMTLLGTGFGYYYYETHQEYTPITKRRRFVLFTSDQIRQLADIEFDAMCKEFRDRILDVEHPVYQRVARVAQRLLASSQDWPQIYDKQWSITVLEDSASINAFVLPNGNIFVFTGMLDLCQTDDELGIVLGHEIAHAVLGHAAEHATRDQLIETFKVFLVGLAWAVLPSDLLAYLGYATAAYLAQAAFHFPYSRDLENEADEVGLQMAAKACVDVRVASAFWSKMSILSDIEGEVDIEFLSTHPAHEKRQKRLEDLLPDAMSFREQCQCPKLPTRDPRSELEQFKEALLANQNKKRPVAILLNPPSITSAVNTIASSKSKPL